MAYPHAYTERVGNSLKLLKSKDTLVHDSDSIGRIIGQYLSFLYQQKYLNQLTSELNKQTSHMILLQQHEFVKGRWVETNLLELSQYVGENTG